MRDEFIKYNISFTPASKDGREYDHLSIYESTFLKGYFVPHPTRYQIYLRKLPLESCLERLNWKNKTITDNDYLYAAFRGSLRALHGHGPGVYGKYRDLMLRCVIDNRYTLFSDENKADLPHWNDTDEELFGSR